MSTLILGSSGYIGKKFAENIENSETMGHENVSVQNLLNRFCSTQFDTIINCAGYVGRPSVDAVEKNKEEAVHGNIVIPSILVEFINIIKSVKLIHISTGCSYESVNGEVFTEEDAPNLDWSSDTQCNFYAGTKSMAEKIIQRSPEHYICRLRMPFDEEDSDRNYLSKLRNYEKLFSKENSLSHRTDFVKACLSLLEKEAPFGIYNVVNSGHITARRVCELFDEYLPSSSAFQFFDDEDQFYKETGCMKRSNCILSNQKLLDAGVEMRSVEEAIIDSLKNWKSL
tara:strand:- start:1837 stop:2688 length:852 start_codon:yes stop_codon:yes gene_type:complete